MARRIDHRRGDKQLKVKQGHNLDLELVDVGERDLRAESYEKERVSAGSGQPGSAAWPGPGARALLPHCAGVSWGAGGEERLAGRPGTRTPPTEAQ